LCACCAADSDQGDRCKSLKFCLHDFPRVAKRGN
jgi:hypothetical protein